MITERDLQEAIAECQGERHPNANTCIKLAAFLTIKEHMFPDSQGSDEVLRILPPSGYSYSPQSEPVETISFQSDSEFSRLVDGRDASEVWPLVDELVSSLELLMPRLYNSFISRLK